MNDRTKLVMDFVLLKFSNNNKFEKTWSEQNHTFICKMINIKFIIDVNMESFSRFICILIEIEGYLYFVPFMVFNFENREAKIMFNSKERLSKKLLQSRVLQSMLGTSLGLLHLPNKYLQRNAWKTQT
jgi:hypothetical protein